MKKYILLLAFITLFSCSTDSETIQETKTATKNTEKRVITTDYNAQKVISDTGYKPNGTKEAYTYNESQCGLIVGANESSKITTQNGIKVQITTAYRYVVVCN